MTTLSSPGKTVSEQGRSKAAVDRIATAVGDMLCLYLERTSG